MKSFIVLALFVAAAVAAPAGSDSDKNAQVLRYDNDNIGVAGFQWAYETSNGISAQEQGKVKNVGSENEAIDVQGSYGYLGPDGVQYVVNYIANENGFQPTGAHLPVPPQ